MATGNCKITTGFGHVCSDLLKSGGADRTFWVGYLSELSAQFDLTQAADISTISFAAYGGLRRFDGNKFSHQFGTEMVKAAGGNISFKQTFVGKLLTTSTSNDLTLQYLALAQDAFIIAQTNNQIFKILGAGKGLTCSAMKQDTGVDGNADIYHSITLESQEVTEPLRFSKGGGYSATLAFLTSVEI